MRFSCWLFFLLLLSGRATAQLAEAIEDPESLDSLPEPEGAYYRYLKVRTLLCIGDGARLEAPFGLSFQGRGFTYDGASLESDLPDPDGVVTLGVLGAVKDFTPETQKALVYFQDWFSRERVDALVLLGDIAATEYELTQVLLACARPGYPVLPVIGNTEGRAAFNRAVLAALKVAPNLINLGIVRRVELGGALLVSLPGYRDRKFVHGSSGCSYRAEEAKKLPALAQGARVPVVLLSHGPPRGSGRRALDLAVEGGNVGDQHLASLLQSRTIPFGIFSHILEAGGQAADHRGRPVAAGEWTESLAVNVGSANPLPWELNDRSLSCGMAVVFRVKGKKASYRLLKYPCGSKR